MRWLLADLFFGVFATLWVEFLLRGKWVDLAVLTLVIAPYLLIRRAWRGFAAIPALIGPIPMNLKSWGWFAVACCASATGAVLGLMPLVFIIGKLTSNFDFDMKKHAMDPNDSLNVFVGCLLAPLFEEIFMRGYFYRSLNKRFSVLASALITAAVFGMLHPINFLGTFIFSLVLTSLYLRVNSLIPGMLIHSLWNATMLLNVISVFSNHVYAEILCYLCLPGFVAIVWVTKILGSGTGANQPESLGANDRPQISNDETSIA